MSKQTFGILIIHGYSGKPIGLQRITPSLEALGLRCHLPTLRGHDQTPEVLNNIHWQEWVEDGEKALDELLNEVEKVIVIGHSMGGWIALHLAIEHKNFVDSVVIAAASTRTVSPMGPGKPLNFFAPLLARLKPRWDMPPVFADPDYITYGNGYEWVPTKTIINVFDFMKATEKRLSEVTVPILVIHSKNDSTNSPQGATLLYEALSTPEDQKRLVWFEKSEHDMFNDCERDAVIQVVADYVKERLEQETPVILKHKQP